MPYSNKVNVIPPLYSGVEQDHISKQEAKKLQRQKWWLLLGTFLLVLIVTLIWVWSRPPIFQSQAIIHFSYPQKMGQELSAVPIEQITLNQKRFTSFRVLQALSDKLRSEKSIIISTEQLAEMLNAEAQTSSRIINLIATGNDASILEPVLSSWLTQYLELLDIEVDKNSLEEQKLIQQKLTALEEKIIQQREILDTFSEENNIISLERDENRTLNKIKGISASLDKAEAQQVEATAILNSLKQAIAEGQIIIRPEDRKGINAERGYVRKLENRLADYAEQYTEKYMNLDPKIVSLQKKYDSAQVAFTKRIATSQKKYVAQTERKLSISQNATSKLNQQLLELGSKAKQFNQKLEEYRRHNESLKSLESQAQFLKDQLIEKEIQKPFEAKINTLERAFVPDFPVAPNYRQNTIISIGVAAISSLFALLLFSFIVRQKQSPTAITSFNVMSDKGAIDHIQPNADMLPHQPYPMLGAQSRSAQLQLEQNKGSVHLRLLTEQECQRLLSQANMQGKIAITLLLHGVSINELVILDKKQIDIEQHQIEITGSHHRVILLPEEMLSLFESARNLTSQTNLIWPEPMHADDISQLIINAGHDAGLSFPDQLSAEVIRHTYITFIVSQGAKLNDVERIAGYISPAELGLYRGVSRKENSLDISELNSVFPLNWHQEN